MGIAHASRNALWALDDNIAGRDGTGRSAPAAEWKPPAYGVECSHSSEVPAAWIQHEHIEGPV